MLLSVIEKRSSCWAWERTYIKSNGRLACWCSSGESFTIIHPNFDKDDFIVDVVNSPQMLEMRLSFIRDNKHYIKECKTCCCLEEQDMKSSRFLDAEPILNVNSKMLAIHNYLLKVNRNRNWPFGSIDKISELQLEPSFPCNLKCPGCLHGWHPEPLSTEEAPYLFPLSWFIKIIDSTIEHAVKLQRIAFVGRGEPTLNKDFPAMIRHARENVPGIVMSMDTNATQPFKEEYLLLDWINCSIDGSTKESYDAYRLEGDFGKTISFIAEAVESKKRLNKNCKIRWKYILFNTSESKELMDKAQEMSKELGVDELNFVITDCGSHDNSVLPAQNMNTLNKVNHYINNSRIFKETVVSHS